MKTTDFSSVQGKTAIITGAASGMGRAMARLFAANGMKIVIADIQDELGEKVAEEIRQAGGEALYCHTNVMKEEDMIRCTRLAVDTYGKLNVMVNNAGVGCAMHPVHEYDLATFQRVNEINYTGVFLGMKYGVKAMLDSHAEGCTVINIASTSGLVASGNYSLYDASKSAVIHLSKTAGLDYARHDITVNVICPGVIDTEIYNTISQRQRELSIAMVPMARFGRPEEISYMALFLASDMARFISGSVITIDGSQTAGTYTDLEWDKPDPRGK